MTETTDDVVVNALEPVAAPVVDVEVQAAPVETKAETVAEETPEPEFKLEAPEEPDPKPKIEFWKKRVNEETNRRREIEEQLAQERREKQEAKALLERMQSGDKETPRANDEQDFEARVEAKATQKAEQALFNNDCNAVSEAGEKFIPDFKGKLDTLRSVGALNDEFLKDIFAVDKAEAHKILDRLAQDPERAHFMTRMDSRKRIAELTRLQMTDTVKPVPAPVVRAGVSKVPPPKPVVDAVSDDMGAMDLTNDKLDDDTWSKMWNKKYRKIG